MCYILPTTYFLPNKTFLLDTYDIILIRIDFERIWISDHNPINNNYQAAPPREPPPTRRYNIRMRVASLVTLRSWWWFEAYCQQDDSSAAWTLWFEHREWFFHFGFLLCGVDALLATDGKFSDRDGINEDLLSDWGLLLHYISFNVTYK